MIEHALILAAGLGTRLKPLTLERPKPLVEVGTVPLVEVALSYARAAGVGRVCLNTHHLHPALEDALAGQRDLAFSYEPEVLGTGGGLRVMWEKLGSPDGPVLVMNADALIDIDLDGMAKVHQDSGAVATLAVKDAPEKSEVWTARQRRGRSDLRLRGPHALCGSLRAGAHVLRRSPR